MKKKKKSTKGVPRFEFHTLYTALLFSMAVALCFAIAAYFAVKIGGTAVIDKKYATDEMRAERELNFAKELQKYVDENELSSEDTVEIARWVRNYKYLYVMIYKEDKLIIDSDSANREPENEGTEDSDGGGESTPGGDGGTDTEGGEQEPGGTDPEGGDGETENDGEDTPGGTQGGAQGGTNPGGVGGITVKFPTREELIKYAAERDSVPITVSDGAILASMADFSEYLYYDIVNIASLVFGALAFILVVLLYFRGVTGRILKLGRDVTRVAEGEMDTHIHAEGRDEISRLGADVENMRSAIVLNLEKERAALDANAELITAMSHDIRTPLTVLLGYIDMMKLEPSPETMREYVRASEKTALRLKKMSDDMFNYFLVFGGEGVKIELEEYDAATLLDQMLAEYFLLLTEQGYVVESTLFPDDFGGAIIKTDAAQLMRIFENIFSNIFKYADKSRPVSILVEVPKEGEEKKIKLSFTNYISAENIGVERNGIGIRSSTKIAEALGIGFTSITEDDKYATAVEITAL